MMWNVFLKKSMVLVAGILVGGVCSAAGATDPAAQLDALDADIKRTREVIVRSEATLEELRRDLYEGAVKAREAKRMADAIEQGKLENETEEEGLGRLRDDITQIGVLLRTFRDRLDAMNDILQGNRKSMEAQQQQLNTLRRGQSDPKADSEVKALKAQLDKANRIVAEHARTISRLTAEGGSSVKSPAPIVPEVASPIVIGKHPLRQGYEALAAGRLEEASMAFKSALAGDPDSDEARLGLASCHFEWNERDIARAMVNEVLERDNANPRALGLKGALELRDGNTRAARRNLEKAVALDETNAYNHNYLGVVYQQLNRHSAAIAQVSLAVELEPDYVGALYNLSVLLATARDPDLEGAFHYYERVLEHGGPRSPQLEALIGEVP